MKFSALGQKALRTIGALGQGVPASPNDMQVAFEAANDMIDAWAAVRLTIFQNLRYVFPIITGKGAPLTPYTIGVGGDFDIARPLWISDAMENLLTSTPALEIPLEILSYDEYANIAMKDMGSAMATALFYNGKFDTAGPDVGLGEIFLYPVPNGQNSLELVLYIPSPMRGFADIDTTEYSFPPGYAEAIRYSLAKRLSGEFRMPLTSENEQLVVDTFAVIQRPNGPVPTLSTDYGLSGRATGMWNWRLGVNTTRRGNY